MDELGRRAVRVLTVTSAPHRTPALSFAALLFWIGTGCQKSEDKAVAVDSAARQVAAAPASRTAGNQSVTGADSLRFVAHDENLPPGFPANGKPLVLVNPYEGDKRATGVGAQLYVSYNCVDCHGVDGSGSMAPTFQDSRWHFGGSPAEVFESIYQGRPDGMPAWGGRISNDQIWMLTAYVRSLSTGDVSSENFTGKTVERTGH